MKLYIIIIIALSVNAEFWDNVERTELYEMMEKSIPEMRITLPENSWNEMLEKAQINDSKAKSDESIDANLKFLYEG